MSQTPQLLNENESNMTIGNRDLATLDDQGQNSYLMAFQDKVDKESISSQRTLRYNDFELIGFLPRRLHFRRLLSQQGLCGDCRKRGDRARCD